MAPTRPWAGDLCSLSCPISAVSSSILRAEMQGRRCKQRLKSSPSFLYALTGNSVPCHSTFWSWGHAPSAWQDNGSRNTDSLLTYHWKIAFFIEFKNKAGRYKVCPSSFPGLVFVRKRSKYVHAYLLKKETKNVLPIVNSHWLPVRRLTWNWVFCGTTALWILFARCACPWIKRSVIACSAVYLTTSAH